LIRQNNVTCTLQLIEHRIDPGKKFTASSPNLDLVYVASHAGTANATVTFPYLIKNSENQSNNNATVSKQFFFTIYNMTHVPTMSQSGQQALIYIATNLPGLQAWSHDWQFLSMGYMTAKNQPGMWQYATVNLRAPSTSSKIPCDHGGWDAIVTIDMKTMKVISAWYPTMESHNCDNIATGGGPISYGGFPTKMDSPLKQFKSGIKSEDVQCDIGFQLILKGSDNSPACVKNSDVLNFIERSWTTRTIHVENTDQSFNYTITSGQLEQAKADLESKSLVLTIKTTRNGTLIAHLPRSLIDPHINGQDSAFVIFEDGKEASYKQTMTEITERTLSIPFQYGVSTIEIIAPEPIR
jgi:hypothetical protein